MTSVAYKAFIEAFKEPLIRGDDDLAAAQQKLEAIHGHPIAGDTQVSWTELGGVRCAWVDAAGTPSAAPTLMLCHGGAWVAAGGDGYLFYAEMLSQACNARVLLVDYRLAPKHRHPAAVSDCVEAYLGLIASGAEPGRVGFIGDSCGGGLAVLALIVLVAKRAPIPACGIALGGWFDLEAAGHGTPRQEPFAHPAFIRARAFDYAGLDADLRAADLSPVHADLHGLPPLLLQMGEVDLTCAEGRVLAERARQHGVEVEVDVVAEMVHGFQGLARAGIPEAQSALARVGAFLARQMD
jgi:monoterpene epsilon-lactone hydrolase